MKFLLLVSLLVFSFAISNAQSPQAVDIGAIKAIEETFRTAWLRNDEKTIMSLLDQHAVLIPGGNAPLRGAESIRTYWFGSSDMVTVIEKFDVAIETVEGTGSFVAVTGMDTIRWTTRKKDGSELKTFVSKGNFIALYAKKTGRWLMLKRIAASKTEEITGQK